MTDTTNTTPAPKKSKKKLYAIITSALILILGVNHFSFRVGYTDVEVTATDSTISVTASPVEAVLPVTDTTKLDTTKK
jgi:hypothetical protein